MDKNKIKKEYNEKIKNLVKLNKYYYDLSNPLVNDNEYDQVKEEILSLEKKYNEKIQNLVKLNKHYYDLSKPLVNDHEYDQIKAEILSLEKQYNFLKSENSPSKVVGFKPSKTFKKVFHRVPMLSLSKKSYFFSKNNISALS